MISASVRSRSASSSRTIELVIAEEQMQRYDVDYDREPRVHSHGRFYLVSDVDARIAKLEQLLSRAEELFQDECDPVSETDSYLWLQDVRSALGKEVIL